ncbi:DNA excision repair protein ERCC-5 homolog [Diretmus argenteus]
MGVHGLWRLLESTGKPINPETLEGKILAVDISIWLNQALKGVRDREGNSVQNAHLLTLFHRICKLLFFRIKPIFVFDGDAPLLKKQTLVLRRQRKEESTRESKQTNEKLLKTFLKRQAIKAALGDDSKDPLPSISSVRRDEVDDMYVLPALPPAEKDKNSSEEEEEKEWEEMADCRKYQGEMYGDPNLVDINSEEFACLPPEMKHDILKDMKDFTKRRRTMYYKPPENSGDFSQYQLDGLLHRNKLNQRLENVEREMNQRSVGGAPQLYEQDGDQTHSIESRRLISEDNAHYILIKGSRKSEQPQESEPVALPWSGGPLSGRRRQGADRPEPLWRPICEEEEGGGPSSAPKFSVLKPSLSPQGDTSPPSPRTLMAIQAAMGSDSSDEEKGGQGKRGGSVSPRTQLAIQQVLAGDDNGIADSRTQIVCSPTKPQGYIQRPTPRLVISSSEEEKEADDDPPFNSIANGNPGLGGKLSDQTIFVKDSLSVSSSEDETEEAIGQRNVRQLDIEKAAESEREGWTVSEGQTKRGEWTEADIGTGSGGQQDKRGEVERRESGHGRITESLDYSGRSQEAASDPRPCSVNLSAQLQREYLNAELKIEPSPLLSEQRSKDAINVLEESIGEDLKTKDSDSEESFVEVSEGEELKEENADDSLVKVRGRGSPAEVREDGNKKEGKQEESLTEALSAPAVALEDQEEEDKKRQTEEKELMEDTDSDSSSTPATNEWEHIDVEELQALESSLQVQQSSLKQQKQQQERMASTVTGQMFLESQELLQLFGMPFLVAPMEAEAQCAALDRTDQTHGTITDDSDVWLFGGRHVYKNFFSQNKYVEHYQYSDLQNQLGLDRTKLINLAYLLGSDYTEGVPGVGYVTGMEILNEFPGPGMEPLTQFSEWWSEAQKNKRLASDPQDSKVKKKLRGLKLQPGFPNLAVQQAYMHPAVDQSDSSFSWGRPQLDLLKEYPFFSRFGWSCKKTEETLQPVLKQLNTHQTQLRIDSFFRMERQERQEIRSQRLRRAVTCLKRKKREGGGQEEEEDTDEKEEEEMLSPSKTKKGKAPSKSQTRGGGGGVGEMGARSAEGGGFLVSEVSSHEPESLSAPNRDTPRPEALPQRAGQSSGSSSSGEDSDGGRDVAMVTARSVFEGNRRGRGGRSTRGRGRGRGQKTKM